MLSGVDENERGGGGVNGDHSRPKHGGGGELALEGAVLGFLTALSVRPGRRHAMVAQRLPSRAWARTMVTSSSGVKGRRSGEDERGGPGTTMTRAPESGWRR